MSSAENAVVKVKKIKKESELSYWGSVFFRFRKKKMAMFCLILMTLIVLGCIFVPIITPHTIVATNVANMNQPPSLTHLFGTDELGRDIYTRMVYGTRVSVGSAALAVLIGLAAGGTVGLVAGFLGGWVDDLLMRFMDLLLAIPGLILAIAVITAWGTGTTKVAFAVGIGSIATIAKTMRSEVVRVRTADYVDAARSSGLPWYSILARHVLPNSWGPVAVLAIIQFGVSILSIASLSYLGFGAPPPAPAWGSIVSDGSQYLATAWWISALPGLVIIALVVSVNHLARGHSSSERMS